MICNFCFSVAARKIVFADPSLRYTSMLLGRYATNQQTILSGFKRKCLNLVLKIKMLEEKHTHFHQNLLKKSTVTGACLSTQT